MPDIYSALMGNAPTNEEQTQALVSALRGQKLIGQLGMLSADPYAAKVGTNLDTSADTQAQQIGQERLRQTAAANEKAFRDAQIENMQAEREHAESALQETMRKNKADEDLKRAELGLGPSGAADPNSPIEMEAQAIAHYDRAPYTSRSARATAVMGRAEQIAANEGYTYDDTAYNNKKYYEKSLTSGPVSNMLNRGGTAVQHLGTLRDAAVNLGNTNLPIWNSIKNRAKTFFGSADVTNWDTLKKNVADEIAAFAVANNASGGSAVFDRKEVEGLANNEKGRAQLVGMMDKWTDLMRGRMVQLKQGYENAVPSFPNSRYQRKEFEELLQPDTRQAFGMKTKAELEDDVKKAMGNSAPASETDPILSQIKVTKVE